MRGHWLDEPAGCGDGHGLCIPWRTSEQAERLAAFRGELQSARGCHVDAARVGDDDEALRAQSEFDGPVAIRLRGRIDEQHVTQEVATTGTDDGTGRGPNFTTDADEPGGGTACIRANCGLSGGVYQKADGGNAHEADPFVDCSTTQAAAQPCVGLRPGEWNAASGLLGVCG